MAFYLPLFFFKLLSNEIHWQLVNTVVPNETSQCSGVAKKRPNWLNPMKSVWSVSASPIQYQANLGFS